MLEPLRRRAARTRRGSLRAAAPAPARDPSSSPSAPRARAAARVRHHRLVVQRVGQLDGPARPAPQVIEAQVRGQPIEPRAERRFAAERLRASGAPRGRSPAADLPRRPGCRASGTPRCRAAPHAPGRAPRTRPGRPARQRSTSASSSCRDGAGGTCHAERLVTLDGPARSVRTVSRHRGWHVAVIVLVRRVRGRFRPAPCAKLADSFPDTRIPSALQQRPLQLEIAAVAARAAPPAAMTRWRGRRERRSLA